MRELGNAPMEGVSLEKLIERDKGICHICGEPVDRNDYFRRDDNYFMVGPRYPSIDHLLPLSRGGGHTWANVKLAHLSCNAIKRDRTEYVSTKGQLAFAL
jgi:5-methylcytosine-specific restriction endonuclease McrA